MADPATPPATVVYTDLDGTLLDHHDYSHDAARPALARLRAAAVPVVLTSSKTLPELREWSRRLDLNAPVIGENGAFVAWPADFELGIAADAEKRGWQVKHFGRDHRDILDVLARLRNDPAMRFSGFSDWSVAEVTERTGLSPSAAALAKQRQASEPIVWEGDAGGLATFREALAVEGLTLTRGGRFHHVMGPVSKGMALKWLQATLQNQWNKALYSLALGDGPNDIEMLESADFAVVVRNPDSPPIEPRNARLTVTGRVGPAGWNEAILELIPEPDDEKDHHE